MKECLIVIDMQNEFLLETGNFTKSHIPNDILLNNVIELIDSFTYNFKPIIFVKAEYSNNGNSNKLTYSGKKDCCKKGSIGAEISQLIQSRMDDTSIIVTKQWYSAFKETQLQSILDKLQIKQIYVAGLKTNV